MKRGSRSLHGRVNEIKSACSLTLQHNSRMVERVVNHEWHAKNMRQPTFFVKIDSEVRNISINEALAPQRLPTSSKRTRR
jgi:uncharacterized membrane protein YgaE (UPF0421/DUF939 family)